MFYLITFQGVPAIAQGALWTQTTLQCYNGFSWCRQTAVHNCSLLCCLTSENFLHKVPGKIRKCSWMGNWNREMLNNGESREPGTCWLPATELVLSCCAQELYIRPLQAFYVNWWWIFFQQTRRLFSLFALKTLFYIFKNEYGHHRLWWLSLLYTD